MGSGATSDDQDPQVVLALTNIEERGASNVAPNLANKANSRRHGRDQR